jgi:hypothetical protein
MGNIINELLRWSEVWPLLIPLTILLIFGNRERRMRPVIAYIIAAFLLMLLANGPLYYPKYFPDWMRNNNILFNALSFLRTVLIGWFIISIPQLKIYKFLKYIYAAYIVAIFVFYTFFQTPLVFSVWALVGGNIVLLFFCITYFLGTILDEEYKLVLKEPEFLICTGFSLYEALNVFVHLFFDALFKINPDFGFGTLKFSKYTLIVLGILLAIALYQSYNRSKRSLKPALN